MRTVEHYQGHVATIPLHATSVEIAEEMRAEEVGSLVVMDRKTPVGIVTDRDLLCRVVAVGRDPEQTRAEEVMSSPLVSVEPTEPLEALVDAMATHGVRRIPVVRSGKLRGIVSLGDAMESVSDECSDLAAGRRRSARAATGRRLYHGVETWIREVGEQLDRLGDETRSKVQKRIDGLLERVGLRES
jgi:CBS domain-containing protein